MGWTQIDKCIFTENVATPSQGGACGHNGGTSIWTNCKFWKLLLEKNRCWAIEIKTYSEKKSANNGYFSNYLLLMCMNDLVFLLILATSDLIIPGIQSASSPEYNT